MTNIFQPSSASIFWLPFKNPQLRRLLFGAALLHVILAVCLFAAGRAQIAPSLIDRDGIMPSFAFDSYEYREKALRLNNVFNQNGIKAWMSERESLHTKLLSIEFAVLGPLFGNTTLVAEPFNLLTYLAVLILVFAIAGELGINRNYAAAAAVGLLPTFLLHTLQFLKDASFIAGVLFILLCITHCLTRSYNLRRAAAMTLFLIAAMSLVLLIRFNFAVGFLFILSTGFVFLLVRQLIEKRALYWNTACLLTLIVLSATLIFSGKVRRIETAKRFPPAQTGRLKASGNAELQIPSTAISNASFDVDGDNVFPAAQPFFAAADNLSFKVGSLRSRFAASYPEAGSGIDETMEIKDFGDFVAYLPRAFEIGMFAPFPASWLTAGQRTGNVGKLISGMEMIAVYACQALILFTFFLGKRRLAAGFLLTTALLSVTGLGLIIPNVGAIYRFRYTFWILLIILAVRGLELVFKEFAPALFSSKDLPKKAVALLFVIVLPFTTVSCSQQKNGEDRKKTDYSLAAEEETTALKNSAVYSRRLSLVNLTGATLDGIYLSPSDAEDWQENLIAGDKVSDDEIIDVEFDEREKSVLWDLKIEATDGHFAEWKNLDLSAISRIKLLLGHKGQKAAVALTD